MTAGSGLIHAEVSSEDFKKFGGDLEILQLWVNLPARHKMVEPAYKGLQQDDIPTVAYDEGKINARVVSGEFKGTKGAFDTLTDVTLTTINFKESGTLELDIPSDHNIFFYLIKGEVEVNRQSVKALHLVEFDNDDTAVQIEALADSTILFGHAAPFNEPVVARGPFVMNSMNEINQAYDDFQAGKLGTWEE